MFAFGHMICDVCGSYCGLNVQIYKKIPFIGLFFPKRQFLSNLAA